MHERKKKNPNKRFVVSWSAIVYNMLPTNSPLYMLIFWHSILCFSAARETIAANFNSILITDGPDGGTTIVSAGGMFELGFFTPNGSSSNLRYLGIWYYKSEPKTVVWVANRDKPINGTGNSFVIAGDGNLNVLDEKGEVYWSSKADSSSSSVSKTAKLMNSGNLVLSESGSGKILWESFKHPTDTFLPGMKMDSDDAEELVLTSWKSHDDPAGGNFTFQIEDGAPGQFSVRTSKSIMHWRSSKPGKFISPNRNQIPSEMANLLSNLSSTEKTNDSKKISYKPSRLDNSFRRLVMGYDGKLRYFSGWDDKMPWTEPRDPCSMHNACGNFGCCNLNNSSPCKCLPGFQPTSLVQWKSGDFSGGCSRQSPICGKNDTFQSLKKMNGGNPERQYNTKSEADCRNDCFSDCSCQAYAYDEAKNGTRQNITTPAVCWIWNEILNNLQEENSDGGPNFYVRLASSPLERMCASSADCNDWPDLTCKAQDGKKMCVCIPNFRWDNSTSSCTREGGDTKQLALPSIIAVTCSVFFLICLCCIIAYVFYTRRRVSKRQGNVPALELYDGERNVEHLMKSGQFRDDEKKGIDVPFFDLETLLAATDNFSDANKLGQGGFGPVYKGKFSGGQEIAVKRLSSFSGQGLQEFKNEVLLIAKLQHRNLVRLMGYCISGEEKMLLYEYMPNKSLDSFIFDRSLCMLLDWEMRFNIILGIARGLLYLHQDSRLRIIHRDLKTSNILLDEEMNPKISDFGLARIFGGKQTEAATDRIIGTYGYMSPEYALEGLFSDKSDIFSFGVVVLEIISGKRNTGYRSEQALSLLGNAWRLWKEEKALDLMDQTLHETCNSNELLKCVNVGLLCVQEDPSDRPTMSSVVLMLGSETATLPSPKQPAFVAWRALSITASSSSKPETSSSYNELSTTFEDGR